MKPDLEGKLELWSHGMYSPWDIMLQLTTGLCVPLNVYSANLVHDYGC